MKVKGFIFSPLRQQSSRMVNIWGTLLSRLRYACISQRVRVKSRLLFRCSTHPCEEGACLCPLSIDAASPSPPRRPYYIHSLHNCTYLRQICIVHASTVIICRFSRAVTQHVTPLGRCCTGGKLLPFRAVIYSGSKADAVAAPHAVVNGSSSAFTATVWLQQRAAE